MSNVFRSIRHFKRSVSKLSERRRQISRTDDEKIHNMSTESRINLLNVNQQLQFFGQANSAT